jgi:starch synthase (maltosyl-transferring)
VTGRLVIDDIRPRTPDPALPAKAVVGEAVRVTAVIFREGHDVLAARVQLFAEGESTPVATADLELGESDEWEATVVPRAVGRHQIVVQAWTDQYATWAARVRAKLEAGQDLGVEYADGAAVLRRLGAEGENGAVGEAIVALEDASRPAAARVAPALAAAVAAALAGPAGAADLTVAAPRPLWVDRERALFSTWYELFPRSYGGFKGTEERVPAVAAMGFDVLYLPPIHPIGTTARKGRGNTARAEPGDVGSPWAIGSAEGGHEAIAGELGSVADFQRLVEEAAARGIEIALDLAFQCSPDHPWVREHPSWFAHRLDGTIACAENPPKRYEDIYPLDFSTEDREGLWEALLGVVRVWVERGVRLFRVDNPHTKPFGFWEWLIDAVKGGHPDVLFLSEAFTRPKVMHRLAKVGFDQSYTYFTWRDTKYELMEYFDELAHGPGRSYFRPNVWPNTPDILARSLSQGGPPAFVTRLVLAAGLSANYGIYGPVFELLAREPAAPGSEEYLASEKYEVRHHDLADPRSIAGLVARVNEARRAHPALQRDRHLRFHHIDNDQILCWSKHDDAGRDAVIGVVNLDPNWTQAGVVDLDLAEIGVSPDAPFVVQDMLDGATYTWVGPRNYVQLDPARRPAHLFSVAQAR